MESDATAFFCSPRGSFGFPGGFFNLLFAFFVNGKVHDYCHFHLFHLGENHDYECGQGVPCRGC